MYNFNQILLENEEILYQGKSVPGKGKNNIIVIEAFIIIFFSVLPITIFFKELVASSWSILIFISILLGLFCAIHCIIYTLFLKDKVTSSYQYCLTNLRILRYNNKKKILTHGFINEYIDIFISSTKDNYGDVIFSKYTHIDVENDITNDTDRDAYIIESDKINTYILFESVENPHYIKKLALEIREKIKIIINIIRRTYDKRKRIKF